MVLKTWGKKKKRRRRWKGACNILICIYLETPQLTRVPALCSLYKLAPNWNRCSLPQSHIYTSQLLHPQLNPQFKGRKATISQEILITGKERGMYLFISTFYSNHSFKSYWDITDLPNFHISAPFSMQNDIIWLAAVLPGWQFLSQIWSKLAVFDTLWIFYFKSKIFWTPFSY